MLAFILINLVLMPIAVKSASARSRPAFVSAYQRCLDASGYITSRVLDCVADEQGRANTLLDVTYRKVLAGLTRDKRRALQLSEKKWLKQIEIECDTDPKVREVEGGTLERVLFNECYLAKTKDRIKWLKTNYLHVAG